MPTGIPNVLKYNENTQRLIEALHELKARVAAEKRRDRARALLVAFARKHGLTAQDLRTAAREFDRKKGGAPVQSLNHRGAGKVMVHALKPAKGKVGKAIRAARIKLNMSDRAVGDAVGCSSSMLGKIQLGINAVPARLHEPLTTVLKLPKGLLMANGHAAEAT